MRRSSPNRIKNHTSNQHGKASYRQMNTTPNSASKAFVAYTSRDPELSNTIETGVAKANRMTSKSLRYMPWIFNDIAGNPIISPILDNIESSTFVVADITYLNPNVVYEIGYAIGQRRRCFLIRHSSTDGDKKIAREIGIFDTLGYDTYSNADELADSLTA